jgi:hypothetical protein
MYMKKITLAALFLFPACLFASVFDISKWEYKAPLEISSLSSEETATIYLGGDVLSLVSNSDRPNVRIIDPKGAEVPYTQLEQEEYSSLGDTVGVVESSLRGGKSVVVLDTGEGITKGNMFQLKMDAKNFKARVFVYGSDVLVGEQNSRWGLLDDANYVYNFFDKTLGVESAEMNVFVPSRVARYLKIEVVPFEGEVTKIEQVLTSHKATSIPKKYESTKHEVTFSVDEEKGLSKLVLDFGSSPQTVEKVSFDIKDMVFNRRIMAEVEKPDGTKESFGGAYIYAFTNGTFSKVKKEFVFSSRVQAKKIEFTIVDNNDAPLRYGPSVDVGVTKVPLLLRSAYGIGTYTLYVGGENAYPVYDLSSLKQNLTTTAPEATLFPLLKNEQFKKVETKISFTEQYPVIFNGVLVLLVLFMAFLIVVYIRKIKA